MNKTRSLLERWKITEEELTELVDQNPSLRGILLGYVAEKKFHDAFLQAPHVTEASKDDDHDRKRKGDRRIVYKDRSFLIEVKSLQSNSVEYLGAGQWCGKAQVDASDSRIVTVSKRKQIKDNLSASWRIRSVSCELLRVWRAVALCFCLEYRPSAEHL